jgi:hypothetical protein
MDGTPKSMGTVPPTDRGAWKGRPVMWGSWAGVRHVVTHAATIGGGVVQAFACGGSTIFWGLEITTWYGARKRHPRLCRRCVAALAAAGRRGRIAPPGPRP